VPDPQNKEQQHPHRKEILTAILANMHNPHFDQINVILDAETVLKGKSCAIFMNEMEQFQQKYQFLAGPDVAGNEEVDNDEDNDFTSNSDFSHVQCIVHKPNNVKEQTRQPTYYDMFHYTISSSNDDGDTVVVLSNADHVYDDTIRYAKYVKPQRVVVLSTWGYNHTIVPSRIASYKPLYDPTDQISSDWSLPYRCPSNSWDTYIYRPKDVTHIQRKTFVRQTLHDGYQPFYMNQNGAENVALYELTTKRPTSGAAAPLQVFHGCRTIRSWHIHFYQKKHKSMLWNNTKNQRFVPGPDKLPWYSCNDVRITPNGTTSEMNGNGKKKKLLDDDDCWRYKS
jgi:hypothetical protein